jgi:3-methyladenine DNA glycosylase AlkD
MDSRKPDGAGAEALADAVRQGLAALADPVRAEGMRAYLKSSMPCLGVATPPRRALVREALADHPPAGAGPWLAAVLLLWREAAFREERHAALDLLTDRRAGRWLGPGDLGAVEELVVTGAWWDLVDPVATHTLGGLLLAHPDQVRPVVLAWAQADDLWLRRSAIICQVRAKAATDTDLLAACIGANAARREFFLRKAIGWALRDHARTDPAWVAAYLDAHAAELSPLSRREAAKHLPATTAPGAAP